MTTLRMFYWLSYAVALNGQVISKGPDITKVEFLVITKDGASLSGAISALRHWKGQDLTDHCVGLVCRNLPAGRYSYSIQGSAEWTGRSQGETLLLYPTALVRVIVRGEEDSGRSFAGVIRRPPAGLLSIHGHAIFGGRDIDARVASNGEFVLHGVLTEQYVISAVSDQGRVLFSESFVCCSPGVAGKATFVRSASDSSTSGDGSRINFRQETVSKVDRTP